MSLLAVLMKEIRRLRREESGVALMLTLSVFLLLYVLCAGVYSIGETVRQKIELQNACDSAAYSAAVVEADGLSRMAMINRAMSWTYVQLTNMQIDYITYRWLELVFDRFKYDRTMCKRENNASFGGATGLFSWMAGLWVGNRYYYENRCAANGNLQKEFVGWFCGVAGYNKSCVRMNNHQEPIMVFKDDDADASIEAVLENLEKSNIERYPEFIDQLKNTIVAYNYNLFNAAREMQNSIAETAMITLMENLPRNGKGQIELDVAKDFLGHVASPLLAYDPYENGDNGCFSALNNTELDERIFLSMADNEVYDNLAQYFGPSGDDSRLAGGLDQWFVRSAETESAADQREVPKTVSALRAKGICRVYKNANRRDVRRFPAYRDHHHDFEDADSYPSCMNTHDNCPEQCAMIADSTAPYAEYEWSSGNYRCNCTHIDHVTYTPCGPEYGHDYHFHKCRATFLDHCDSPRSGGHQCPLGHGTSHARSEYFSCVAKKDKRLTIPFFDSIEWTPSWLDFIGGVPLDCSPGNIGFGSAGFGIDVFGGMLSNLMPGGGNVGNFLAEGGWKLTEKIVGYSNKYRPNGFARIYGDDREIYNTATIKNKDGTTTVVKTHCGEVAKPWVLNSSFYGKNGAIIVGFARKQRNPWTFLLNAIDKVIGDDRSDEDGIYSAFNPVTNGWMVAFSAARAAHRFHPSNMALAKAKDVGYPFREFAAINEYETRYDAVCDDDDGGSDKWGDEYGRFTVKCANEDYRKFRIGCVCNDGSPAGKENTARFARCWNLCETDWDATLLPLRFAWAGPRGECFDSFAHDLTDGRRIGNITWENVGVDVSGMNPLLHASGIDQWSPFVTPEGTLQYYDESKMVDGDFMLTRAPARVVSSGTDTYVLPYSTDDPETKLQINRGWRPKKDGELDLNRAIQIRIL